MTKEEKRELLSAVKTTFLSQFVAWSADDIIIDDETNRRFTKACRDLVPSAKDYEINWTLLNLRKSSNIGPSKGKKKRRPTDHSDYLFAAEIAARQMEDKYRLTIDRVLCDPERKSEFDSIAKQIVPDVTAYLLRKAALTLRKTRRLRPEFIKRIANWGTSVITRAAQDLQNDPESIPRQPGIYIIRDKSGYLYIGEADNLHKRLKKQLDHSDRKALARYLWEMGIQELSVELHVFAADSEGRRTANRRAYESELIRSRKPRFNIRDRE
jgi:predicted GIY-YIG superfamily endonuclease